jgi:hypothetical protein
MREATTVCQTGNDIIGSPTGNVLCSRREPELILRRWLAACKKE